jgi:hypothetical protein
MLTAGFEEARQQPPLIQAMMEAGFYPGSCNVVELCETLTSWLFFAGDLVYWTVPSSA